ncbi:MAG: AAA family ATPase [Candidatus Nanohaloarchaea archaeon]
MIEKIEVENWRSHRENSVELDAGVNAIVGDMGSGKSSLLEAATFALYGTTPALNSNDVRLDEVLRRNPEAVDETSVAVEFSTDGNNYRVERSIERGEGTTESRLVDMKSGETLEEPKTRDVTEEVEKILGMDFRGFTRAVYSEQNNLDLFLNMRPGERKERLDELLDLERFESGRKTAVKARNRLKDRRERRLEQVEELEEDLDAEELEALREDISRKKNRKDEIEDRLEELENSLEELEEREEELKEKRDSYRELEERKTRLKTREESIEERISELDYLDVENPDKKIRETEERLEELREKRDRIEELEDELEEQRDDLQELEREIEELEEKAEKFEEFDGLQERIEEIENELEEKRDELASVRTRTGEIQESLSSLEDASGDCPVCGRPLDDQHREELLEEKREEIEELETRRHELENQIEELEDELEKRKEKRDRLLKHEDAGEKLEEKREERKEARKRAEELEDAVEELDRPGNEIEELEEKLERLQDTQKKEELEEELDDIEEKKSELEEEMEDNSFSESRLEELQEEISQKKQQVSRLEEKKSSVQQLLKEKAKRLNELEKQFEKKEEYREELEKLDTLTDFMHEYEKALEQTQLQLRERFVEKLNDLMDELWNQIYPYDYYYSLRLNPSRDYALELLDAEENWISAEGEVSGGERHSAALALRLGLTFILSPEIGVLMLDEPTHNMDSSGVSELAETLGTRTSDLLEQLVVVTHDRDLEEAATGKLYECSKTGGTTSVNEIS